MVEKKVEKSASDSCQNCAGAKMTKVLHSKVGHEITGRSKLIKTTQQRLFFYVHFVFCVTDCSLLLFRVAIILHCL